MFSDKEINNLKLMTSKKIKLSLYAVFIFSATTLFISGSTNFIRANNFANMINLNLVDVFFTFLKGFEISKNYSGPYCIALQRLLSGLIQILIAIFCIFLIPLLKSMTKRNVNIIELIEQKD